MNDDDLAIQIELEDEYPILGYFNYGHLPEKLKKISEPFCDLAHKIVRDTAVVDVQQMQWALKLLLQAKDAAVRSALK